MSFWTAAENQKNALLEPFDSFAVDNVSIGGRAPHRLKLARKRRYNSVAPVGGLSLSKSCSDEMSMTWYGAHSPSPTASHAQ